MHRQASRSQHCNSKARLLCIKELSQFRTTYYTNLWQYSKRPKRGGVHDNALIPYSPFWLLTSAPENCVVL